VPLTQIAQFVKQAFELNGFKLDCLS